MSEEKIKFEFKLNPKPIVLSSDTVGLFFSSFTINDKFLPLYLTLKAKNVGYYQYISKEQNLSPLITGSTTGFTLFDKNFILPPETTIHSNNNLISGYCGSDLIVSIKSYDSLNPYKIGTKVIDGTSIEINEVNVNYVGYKIDLINYITFFNKNLYSSEFTSSTINRFIFDSIEKNSDYILTILYEPLDKPINASFYVFKNNSPLMLVDLKTNAYKELKIPLVSNDFIEVVVSSITYTSNTNDNLFKSLVFKLKPEEILNEKNFTTLYYFGQKSILNFTNEGFIYKSDTQHYDEKPIIDNRIKIERSAVSVFDSIFRLGSIGNVNDFEEFYNVE